MNEPDKYRLKAANLLTEWHAKDRDLDTIMLSDREYAHLNVRIADALTEAAHQATERAAEIAELSGPFPDVSPNAIGEKIAEAIRKELGQ